jgi:hypothetical protein
MPYKLRKAPKRDLYWVVAQDGRHMSEDPIPKERAEAQMRALYASESRLPAKYTAGLTPVQKVKQVELIKKSSKKYKETGLVTDRPKVSEKPTKRSVYVTRFEKKYGFPVTDHERVKSFFPDTDVNKILSKGAAAYASGSRPNTTIGQWVNARLASVLTGGPALKIDNDLVGPISKRKIN